MEHIDKKNLRRKIIQKTFRDVRLLFCFYSKWSLKMSGGFELTSPEQQKKKVTTRQELRFHFLSNFD